MSTTALIVAAGPHGRSEVRTLGPCGRSIGPAVLVALALFVSTALHSEPGCGANVTVERGDTLSRIADRCGTTEGRLLRANPEIDGSEDLRVGMQLDLRPPEQQLGERFQKFGNRATDAIVGVARDVGSSVEDLLNRNPDLKQRLYSLGGRFHATAVDTAGATISLSPSKAAAGSPVTVSAIGLPGNTPVLVGAGSPGAAYDVLEHARTAWDGTVRATVRVPDWAEPQKRIVFVVAGEERNWSVRSAPFEVAPSL